MTAKRLPMDLPKPGQRWISTTEPELGLGLIMEADHSSTRVLFPACGELRSYALASAPLQRLRFALGDKVETQEGASFRVERIEEDNGLLTYYGDGQALPEPELADRAAPHGPQDRFLQGQTDEPGSFELRLDVWQQQHRLATHPGRGLMGGRIDWIPHQIAIAHEVSRRIHPRVLLADEVGLGKTIEAALILHHALVTGQVQRALILVPNALVHQWFVELLRRFQLSFAIYDAQRCAAIQEGNPFLDEQWVLCSMQLLADSPVLREAAVDAGWDLLIVDEAHHLTWGPTGSCAAYQTVEALARVVPSLLLLTATPEQMGLETHFAHLRLLDPDRYTDFPTFEAEQGEHGDTAKDAEILLARGETEALRRLLDQHGPGRVMFRNTREQIKGFPKRHAHPVVLEERPGAKLDWLLAFLNAHPREKILLMTRSPEQVLELDDALHVASGVSTVLFHEGQSLLERDRQAAWFAEDDGAQLMLASDIGGEGRNFQFVHHLILFDLPRHPERVEQRIGRLDRIGQGSDIHIHIPAIANSPEAHLLRWLHEGLNAFTRPLQCGQRVFEIYEQRLGQMDDALIEEIRNVTSHLEAEQRRGRNRLIQLKHELEEDVEAELAVLRRADDDPELLPFAQRLWQPFGIDIETLNETDYLLRPGPLYSGDLPLPVQGRPLTTTRSRALAREDLDLLTWDHPLLRDGMEALLSSPLGSSCCCHAKGIRGPILQVLLILEATAPGALQVQRFLPPTPLLISLDAQGQPFTDPIVIDGPADAGALRDHEAFRTQWFPERLEEAMEQAETQAVSLRASALTEASDVLGRELKRLIDLRSINDHVREDEIAALGRQLTAVSEAIQQARLRVDALRLVL